MRLLVLSDSHGDAAAVRLALARQPDVQNVFFLGDGIRDLAGIRPEAGRRNCFVVRGNNDFGCQEPLEALEELRGKRIFYTHGHTYQVKYGDGALRGAARSAGADIVLYGHTHRPVTDYEDGLYLMNPGSLRDGAYGVVDITPQGIVCVLQTL